MKASLFVASMLLGATLDAQAPMAARSATGVIDGTVTDTNLVALSDAVAAIIGTNLRVATGANGKFRIVGLAPGVYILVVSRHGFVPATSKLDVPANADTLRVSFALETDLTPLDPAALGATPQAARLAEFEERTKRPYAVFMRQAEIEQLHATSALDVVRALKEVRVVGKIATSPYINITRPACPFELYVDGTALPSPDLGNLPSPNALAGIEVFSSLANIPLQYRTNHSQYCGAVFAWTKTGP